MTLVTMVGIETLGRPWWDRVSRSQSFSFGSNFADYYCIVAFTTWIQAICYIPPLTYDNRIQVSCPFHGRLNN